MSQSKQLDFSAHQWTGCQSDPLNYPGEYVRYCSICGMEDTCEDPLPPCPGQQIQMAEIRYTTPDGIEHRAVIKLATYLIMSVESLVVGDIAIPPENVEIVKKDPEEA